MFITRQLKGLEDTKSAQFNRYFYLLEVWHPTNIVKQGLTMVFEPASDLVFHFLALEHRLGEVLQHLLWIGGQQWDLYSALQNTVPSDQVSLLFMFVRSRVQYSQNIYFCILFINIIYHVYIFDSLDQFSK